MNSLNAQQRLIVLGVGNLLLCDEGLGIHAIRELQKLNFPPQVVFIDGGTTGFELIQLFHEGGAAIIIDCIDAGAEPGTILRLKAEEIELEPDRHHLSVHEFDLKHAMYIAKMKGMLPPTVIYGIQPGEITWGLELSPPVRRQLPSLVSLVIQEINHWLDNKTFLFMQDKSI